MVLQKKNNAFEIDLWEPVVKLIGEYVSPDGSKMN
jgi:hypothetical protein